SGQQNRDRPGASAGRCPASPATMQILASVSIAQLFAATRSSRTLGCNNFGMRCDAAQTQAVVQKALELGITLFDTADIYARGASERLLGQALGNKRKDIVLATKFSGPMSDSPLDRGASKRYVHRALEASLARLGTDYIDLYQVHFPDAETPIAETLEALNEAVQQGKVRYVGCSNFAGWMLVDALWTSEQRGLARFVSAQNHYNLLERTIRHELLPACAAHRIGVLPYFPLASGLLTGKYRRGEAPGKDTRLGLWGERGARLLNDDAFAKVDRFDAFAKQRDKTLLDLAFGWLLSQREVPSVIAGATKPEQVESNVKAGEYRLGAEDMLALAPLL
ncbi:MAG TPA: aldo/keto reductase, partial [Polyangiales bacterium]|nr:aldo/keto reductase [Polyangiales bacterium]